MRKLVVIAGLCFATGAMAADKYGTAGCGLGSLVFGNQKGIVQIFAATTNGLFGSQTFGITTGTSNVEPAFTGPGGFMRKFTAGPVPGVAAAG